MECTVYYILDSATLPYIVSLAEPGAIGPISGTSEDFLFRNMIGYVSGEVHGTCGHLFNPSHSPEAREYFEKKYATKLSYLNDHLLKDKPFLMGDAPSAVDFYLYIVLSWSPYLKVDMSNYGTLNAYSEKIASHPKVVEA